MDRCYGARPMTSTPLVSIGIPTYDRAQKLERAVGFVLAQDYKNIEVVNQPAHAEKARGRKSAKRSQGRLDRWYPPSP
jgi:GT2 family glycosyltransferase